MYNYMNILRDISNISEGEKELLLQDIDFSKLIKYDFVNKRKFGIYDDRRFKEIINLLKFSGNTIQSLYDVKEEDLMVDVLVFDLYSESPILTFMLDLFLQDKGSKNWNIYTICNNEYTINTSVIKNKLNLVLPSRCKFIDTRNFLKKDNKYTLLKNNAICYFTGHLSSVESNIEKLRQPSNLACDIFTLNNLSGSDSMKLTIHGKSSHLLILSIELWT